MQLELLAEQIIPPGEVASLGKIPAMNVDVNRFIVSEDWDN